MYACMYVCYVQGVCMYVCYIHIIGIVHNMYAYVSACMCACIYTITHKNHTYIENIHTNLTVRSFNKLNGALSHFLSAACTTSGSK